MMRFTRLPLAAGALGLLLACHGDRAVTPEVAPPSFTLDDGTRTGGNPDFFFLPPIVPNPSGNAKFDASEFNPDLQPVVNVCQLSGNPSLGPVSCETIVFGPVTAQAAVADQHYTVNWHTDQSNGEADLDVNEYYRIQVFISEGGTRLGFADVDPVSTGKELKNLQTGDVFGLVDGRTLPIKFRIEEGALCQPLGNDTCSSKTIVLADGGTVVLEETGDRVDIPPQTSTQVITVTLQLCDGLEVDSPTFGNCLTVTADPPLAQTLDPKATVSICSISSDPAAGALTEAQEDLLTLYRQNGAIVALPHAEDFCDAPISSVPPSLLQQFAGLLGRVLAPRTLYARTAVLNVGDAGDTEKFSDFQLVLPGQMFPLDGTGGQSADPGSAVIPPGVRVVDRDGTPVAGATVLFQIAAGGGSLDAGTVVPCRSNASLSCVMSNTDGIATTASWILGSAGTNTVRASGFGIADPGDPGPFMPENLDEAGQPIPADQQATVSVGTGEVFFSATAAAPALIDFETYPDGSPTCSECPVGDEYASLGVVFSFTSDFTEQDRPHIVLNSNNPEGVSNHDVTFPSSPAGGRFVGTTIMTFSGAPTSVRFEARVNNDIEVIPVAAFAPDEEPISESQVTRSDVIVYAPGGGSVQFRQETIEVTNPGGIDRIELSGGGAGGFLILLDDLDFQINPVTSIEIDGVMSPGEWDGAAETALTVNVPGGTTPATLFVKNDATNLYLAVRFQRSMVDGNNLLNFEFDNNNNGTGPGNGDDYVTFSFGADPSSGVFSDAHRTTCPSPCSVTTDIRHGSAAFANDGTFSVYEMSHPLNSGETGKDFALTPPTTIGMLMQLTIGSARSRYPAGTFPTYVQISITSP